MEIQLRDATCADDRYVGFVWCEILRRTTLYVETIIQEFLIAIL